MLEKRGTVTEGDVATLAVYAELLARWIQCEREIGQELMIESVVLDNNGMPHKQRKVNPLLKVANACETRLLALAKTLGLTPVDRDKVKRTAVGTDEEIIPGSMADYIRQGAFEKVVPIDAAQLAQQEAEENGNDAVV